MSERALRVVVWNEGVHERKSEKVRAVYPKGLHAPIVDYLNQQPGIQAKGATLNDSAQGLPDDVLECTDVLLWWGHTAHKLVEDDLVNRIHARVLQGMGLIPLHSAHFSKIFIKLMGTGCNLKWHEIGEKERIWVVAPEHPIAEGLGDYFELEHEEMYGEKFDIPQPDHLIFVSWFPSGHVFRSGACFYRGKGKIFYFRPGHETYPIYYDPTVLKVIGNAVRWAAPSGGAVPTYGKIMPPLENVPIQE